MDEKQYHKAVAKAKEEYEKNLEAINRVWLINHPNTPTPTPAQTTERMVERMAEAGLHATPLNNNGFVLSLAVKESIAQLPETQDISQPMILKRLLAQYPEIKPRVKKEQFKPQIAGVLGRLAKAGKLERIKASHGSEPSIFRKKAEAWVASGENNNGEKPAS
jgi:hypothetical protein